MTTTNRFSSTSNGTDDDEQDTENNERNSSFHNHHPVTTTSNNNNNNNNTTTTTSQEEEEFPSTLLRHRFRGTETTVSLMTTTTATANAQDIHDTNDHDDDDDDETREAASASSISVLDRTTHVAIGYSTTNSSSSSSSSIPSTAEELMDLLKRIKTTSHRSSSSLTEIRLVAAKHRRPLPMLYLRTILSYASASTTGGGGGCRFLVRLQLNRVGITDDLLHPYITQIVCQNPSLMDLDLTKNEITNRGLEQFISCLETTTFSNDNPAKLKRLILEGNSRMNDIASLCNCLLLQSSQSMSELQILKIGKIPWFGYDSDGSASSTSEQIQNNNNNNLRAICQSILTNPNSTIRKLDLRKTQLGNQGTIQLAQAISSSSLTTNNRTTGMSLGLGRNAIGDVGMHAMAQALRTNTSIRSLDVQGNPDITDASMQTVWECLQFHNSHLQKFQFTSSRRWRHASTTAANHPPPAGISDGMRQQLLDVLICNSHGPELAQRTKRARQTIHHHLLQVQQWHPTSSSSSHSQLLQQDHSESTTTFGSTSTTIDSWEEGGDNDDDDVEEVWWRGFRNKDDGDDGWCVICYESFLSQPCCALLPCMHQNCCHACAERLHQCPFCRETIVQIVPIKTHHQHPSLLSPPQQSDYHRHHHTNFPCFSKYPRSYRRSVITTTPSAIPTSTSTSTTFASSSSSASVSHTPPFPRRR